MLKKIINFFKNQYSIEILEEFPEYPKQKIIYLIGERNSLNFLSMLCPCGCGANIRLSLIQEDSPSWSISINKDLISVYPSVWRNRGCRSHFFVRSGKIKWVRARTRTTGNYIVNIMAHKFRKFKNLKKF